MVLTYVELLGVLYTRYIVVATSYNHTILITYIRSYDWLLRNMLMTSVERVPSMFNHYRENYLDRSDSRRDIVYIIECGDT